MFGDGVGRQQPQHAFAGLVLFGAAAGLSCGFLRGGAERAGEDDRQRETHEIEERFHGTPGLAQRPPGAA